ncbi:glutamyl-tRNA reductase [Mobilicoccus pelagius]|uniref:Glutamyl-tRNA reductase n=1 Tax=Mobilicoccus pelagius NBRC 104925 TaxID=1089455 RepID=H5US30_9MICO|nr:glutamyl-tRNA reductase [Mobilicoccus pelagius]GAB48538.1 glutamyl-tRNA reductase [Mobilicoccus pelagius NBRC 104925]
MSLVVMGISHHSAPMALLERISLDAAAADLLTSALLGGEHIDEVALLATCNRLEVYAEASAFHGAVAHIGDAVARITGVDREELNAAFYVHYEDRAIAHVFSVACGLDAMAVGEAQILGQIRETLARGQASGAVGHELNLLLQHALRVGKRAHSDTDLDRYGSSLVVAGLDRAERHVGSLASASVLVVGAGAMSSLVATTAARRGVASLGVVNRTTERSSRLAAATGATAYEWDALHEVIAAADVVVTCTGAMDHVVDTAMVAAAMSTRPSRPLALVDLALPRDVDPAVGELPGCRLLALENLGHDLAETALGGEALRQVQDLVVSEVAAFLVSRRQEAVGPAVAALRQHAASVVSSEMERLDARVPDMDPRTREEVKLAVHRVVEKLLHTPTVRVKELTARGRGVEGGYADALRELFDLDHAHVSTVSRPPERGGAGDLP